MIVVWRFLTKNRIETIYQYKSKCLLKKLFKNQNTQTIVLLKKLLFLQRFLEKLFNS